VRAAFLVTSHHDLRQLRRLVTVLTEADDRIKVYISHDLHGEDGVLALQSDRCEVHLHQGGRGDFTQVERVLALLEAVEHGGGADSVTVLSGADYPARPIRDFLAFVENSGDGLLHHFPALDDTRSDWRLHESRQRYLFRWHRLCRISDRTRDLLHPLHALNYTQPLLRINVAYGWLQFGLRRGHIPPGFHLHGGSAWFSLTWDAVEHVLKVCRTRPDLLDWGRQSIAIDEAFFHTILASAPHPDLVNDNARYIDFGTTDFGPPRTLDDSDLVAIDASGAYFVRKVDSSRSAGLLALLDERLHRSPALDPSPTTTGTSPGNGARP
jgi:hypothetical protein